MSGRKVKFSSIKRKKRAKVFRGYKSAPPASTSTPAPAPTPPASSPAPTLPTPAPTLPTPAPTVSIPPSSTSAHPPTSSDEPVAFSTRSSKKIALSRDAAAASSQPGPSSEDNCGDYHLIRMSNLKRAVSAFSCCGSPLSVTEDRTSRRGFVVKMAICCTVCGKKSKITDPYCEDDLEVNSRSVLASRVMGKGRSGLATFACVMGMLPPLTQTHHSYHYDDIKRATEAEKQSNMSAAAALLRKDADEDEIVDVKVTCDATWQKRGHQSLYGVVVVASWDTGQVLDTEVLSKWCHECNAKRHLDPTSEQFLDWWEGHQHLCGQSFYGSAGSMEAEGALNIWKRSVEKHKLRYTAMIADGDSSTYPTICDAKPYGDSHPIIKHECVGHVQKRMYAHLKTAKAKPHFGADGKRVRMGGKGRLTDVLMKKFQRFYGKAIRSNVNNAEAMKRAVMAIFYHSYSTDDRPLHFMCPASDKSWCKYQRAIVKGEPPPPAKPTIHPDIGPYVKRVFLDLSEDSLMERCVLGATQNQNESFNSIIWNRCPKTDFASVAVVEMCVDLAVITFNSGMGALRGVLKRLNYHCGPTTSRFLDKVDDNRIWMASYKGKELVKKRRRQMRLDRVTIEEEQAQTEGVTYSAGAF